MKGTVGTTPKPWENSRTVALAGNPNVGKSTVFNALTGLRQHTGNWPGKTVATARGTCLCPGGPVHLVDLPGCYSLLSHSPEEEIARDALCLERPAGVVVVCDATCLERSLGLVLQTLEITSRAVVCVNLLDEAEKKGITVDLDRLSRLLGVPVVGMAARSGRGLEDLLARLEDLLTQPAPRLQPPVTYPAPLEAALARPTPLLRPILPAGLSPRWTALRLLEGLPEGRLARASQLALELDSLLAAHPEVSQAVEDARSAWEGPTSLPDAIVAAIVRRGETLARAVTHGPSGYSPRDRKLDRIFTGKVWAFPVMAALMVLVFWLTISGANVPSQLLAQALFWGEDRLRELFTWAHLSPWLINLLLSGVYRTVAWVVSVMLPPMAIFFPLFTLLEDLGYLPRMAFNLDRCFHACGACGKQALTTAMAFGCNAAGVTGCRIIDSPRERLLAILTNNFTPCNGRLPLLISLITLFFTGLAAGPGGSLRSALLLAGVILLGLAATFGASRLLSRTLLKGEPSSFTLELPPYRRPQIGRVLVRSVLDRTLFVLGRAVAVAAPAGLVIWILANVPAGEGSLLTACAGALDPFARLFGLDGAILLAFLLGFPANELVLPLLLMIYLSQGALAAAPDLPGLYALLTQQGWTGVTALCVVVFTVMHWPCSTTLLTVWRETKSLRWTALAAALPTACGLGACFLIAQTARLLGC